MDPFHKGWGGQMALSELLKAGRVRQARASSESTLFNVVLVGQGSREVQSIQSPFDESPYFCRQFVADEYMLI